MNELTRPMLFVLALAAAGCASAPRADVHTVLSCDELFEEAPDLAGNRVDSAPQLRNVDAVAHKIEELYKGHESHSSLLQLLVQPDGHVSHGCVYRSSGDRTFDQMILHVGVEWARFRPARRDDEPVAAWVRFPLGAVRSTPTV